MWFFSTTCVWTSIFAWGRISLHMGPYYMPLCASVYKCPHSTTYLWGSTYAGGHISLYIYVITICLCASVSMCPHSTTYVWGSTFAGGRVSLSLSLSLSLSVLTLCLCMCPHSTTYYVSLLYASVYMWLFSTTFLWGSTYAGGCISLTMCPYSVPLYICVVTLCLCIYVSLLYASVYICSYSMPLYISVLILWGSVYAWGRRRISLYICVSFIYASVLYIPAWGGLSLSLHVLKRCLYIFFFLPTFSLSTCP